MNWNLFAIRLRKLAAIATCGFFRRSFLGHFVAPAIEHNAIIRTLPFDLAVDAGANRGQFSLLCRHLRPGARIIAFEPLPDPASVYRALFARDSGVTLQTVALAPERGEMVMNISKRDDSSSLLPISNIQVENYPGTECVGNCRVKVAPLTDFIGADELTGRSLLKVDVQGFELEVLRSGEGLLGHFDWIYIECSFARLYEGQALADDVVAYLASQGFVLSGKYNLSHGKTGSLLQADYLFSRA